MDTFWGVLSKATTVLEKTAEGENVDEESANMSGRSDSEIALVQVNREVMASSQNIDETPEEIADGTELDKLAWIDQVEDDNADLLDDYDDLEEMETNEESNTATAPLVVDDAAE